MWQLTFNIFIFAINEHQAQVLEYTFPLFYVSEKVAIYGFLKHKQTLWTISTSVCIHYLWERTVSWHLLLFFGWGCDAFAKITRGNISVTGPFQWCNRFSNSFFKHTEKYICIPPFTLKLSISTYNILLPCWRPVKPLNTHLTDILYMDYTHLNSRLVHIHKQLFHLSLTVRWKKKKRVTFRSKTQFLSKKQPSTSVVKLIWQWAIFNYKGHLQN